MHDSFGSKVAEALAREYVSDAFDAYSAGSESGYTSDNRVIRMLLEYCDCNITEKRLKPMSELTDVDIVITMEKGEVFPSI